MLGIRSGAVLNNPGMFFDLKPSADFSSVFKPLLNFLNDCAAERISHITHQVPFQLTLSACRKSLILQFLAWIRETIRSRSGRPLASAVNSSSNAGSFIKSSTASSLCKKCLSAQHRPHERIIPRINIPDLAEGHAEPYPEQSLPYRIPFRTAHLTPENSRT